MKWKEFKNSLAKIDLFGQKFDFSYNRETVFQTYYGAIFTILFFTFLIFAAVAGYMDLTTRLNPIINIMELEDNSVPLLDLQKNNITIALGFVSDSRSEYLYDPTFFEIEARYTYKSKNESSDITKSFSLQMKNCTINNFINFKKVYQNFDLFNAMCLQIPEGAEIFSQPEEFTETYLKINVKYCKNETDINIYLNSNKVCKPVEEINERLLNLNLYLYITHDYFDGMDPLNPIQKRLSMEKWNFDDLYLRRRDSFYFTYSNLKDYNDLMMGLSEPAPRTFLQFQQKDIVRNFKFIKPDEANKKFMEIWVKANSVPRKIIRKYTTFVDLLATLGGLANIFIIVGNLIFAYVGRIFLDIKIINDHFNISKSNSIELEMLGKKRDSSGNFCKFNEINNSHNKDNKSIQGTYTKNPFQNSGERTGRYSYISFNKEIRNSQVIESDYYQRFSYVKNKDNQIFNSGNSQKESLLSQISECESSNATQSPNKKGLRLKYSFKDVVYSIFYPNKKSLQRKNQIYENCKKIIDEHIDVKNIISVMQEYKILRTILLDPLQLSLINYYKKPVLKISNDIKDKIVIVHRKSNLEHNLDDENLDKKLLLLNERYIKNKNAFDERVIDLTKH
jgi:hypothetical protein